MRGGEPPVNMILEASQAGSRERANFQQKIMRTPKIILAGGEQSDIQNPKQCHPKRDGHV
jgi:hypothetical protein